MQPRPPCIGAEHSLLEINQFGRNVISSMMHLKADTKGRNTYSNGNDSGHFATVSPQMYKWSCTVNCLNLYNCVKK